MNHLEKLRKVLPGERLGPLKDMASEVVVESARLEGGVAEETARGLGNQLRLLNAYHSNLIEGHKTGILDIREALRGEYGSGDGRRYAQELCAAHVVTEREMMARIAAGEANPFDPDFLPEMHRLFYSQLPPEHQFCHGRDGFTHHSVMPGAFRDREVSVDGETPLGPPPAEVPDLFAAMLALHSPEAHHGDERLLAILAMHHRLAWIHPFRDGNGRMTRLHTSAALAFIGIDRTNLWSLSRGLSRNKNEYYIHLRFADSFRDEDLADFLELCLEQCLDQIRFVGSLLDLNTVERRIEEHVGELARVAALRGEAPTARILARPEIPALLREVFRRGSVRRGRAYEVFGVQRKRGREMLDPLLERGLLVADSERSPLRFGFPEDAMPAYFPLLYKPSIMRAMVVEEGGSPVAPDEPLSGVLVRDGDRAKIMRENGVLIEIGGWRDAYGPLLARRVTVRRDGGRMEVLSGDER